MTGKSSSLPELRKSSKPTYGFAHADVLDEHSSIKPFLSFDKYYFYSNTLTRTPIGSFYTWVGVQIQQTLNGSFSALSKPLLHVNRPFSRVSRSTRFAHICTVQSKTIQTSFNHVSKCLLMFFQARNICSLSYNVLIKSVNFCVDVDFFEFHDLTKNSESLKFC